MRAAPAPPLLDQPGTDRGLPPERIVRPRLGLHLPARQDFGGDSIVTISAVAWGPRLGPPPKGRRSPKFHPIPRHPNPAHERGHPSIFLALASPPGFRYRPLIDDLHDSCKKLPGGSPPFGRDCPLQLDGILVGFKLNLEGDLQPDFWHPLPLAWAGFAPATWPRNVAGIGRRTKEHSSGEVAARPSRGPMRSDIHATLTSCLTPRSTCLPSLLASDGSTGRVQLPSPMSMRPLVIADFEIAADDDRRHEPQVAPCKGARANPAGGMGRHSLQLHPLRFEVLGYIKAPSPLGGFE